MFLGFLGSDPVLPTPDPCEVSFWPAAPTGGGPVYDGHRQCGCTMAGSRWELSGDDQGRTRVPYTQARVPAVGEHPPCGDRMASGPPIGGATGRAPRASSPACCKVSAREDCLSLCLSAGTNSDAMRSLAAGLPAVGLRAGNYAGASLHVGNESG